MSRVLAIGFFVFFFSVLLLEAQELPPIQIYTSEMYGAENQNWSIAQSKEQYIYVANNKGLLEFNGAEWKLYPSPNETIMRSVRVIDDYIYTGCSKEFGYWQRNEFGVLYYTSLSKNSEINFLEEEEFWSIVELDEYILFQSLQRIYIYNKNNQSFSIINSETTIHKMFLVNEIIYFQKAKQGIYKIENGVSKLVSDSQILKDNLLVNVFNYKDKFLVQTEDNGFYFLEEHRLIEWNTPANEKIKNEHVFRSIQLKDGSFILGTRSNGVLHITSDGDINYHINIVNGLSNNTIHAVFEDDESNIWLALDNGINCVNIKSPFKIYNDKEGKIGTVYASAVYNKYLYLGTNQGLYAKLQNSNDEFKFIDGTQGPVRCLVEQDNTLFCGHNTGTFIVNGVTAELILDIEGTWNIKPINKNADVLLQGNYNGLNVIEKKNGKWVLKNKIEGFNNSSRYFEIHDKNEIFVSHEYKGVYKINVNDSFTKAEKIIKDTIINKGLNSSLIKYNSNLFYAYKAGVFKYDASKNRFVKDSVLNRLYANTDYTSGKLIYDSENNILWSFSKNNLNYVSPSKLSAVPKVNKVHFSTALPKGLTSYENISHLKNSEHLIGTSNGYLVLDLDKLKEKSHRVSINSITKSNIKDESEIVNKVTEGDFKHRNNNIEFTYSIPEFDKYLDTKYQYQLEGIYPDWSKWSSNSSVLFKNLPFGDYVFNIKGKVGNDVTNNIASYRFTIQRPWYLSNSLIALYMFAFLLFAFALHNIYKRYYRKQRDRLLLKSMRELELKELENKQLLMRFNNDKLRQDIENKNRELGISTMSLIKKNEFLNSIKKELQNVEDTNNLKKVIKIIDRNLNNNDDWHVFEEAFNNADKDFLKKIKTLHPALTSNDLRLCAYLRLNLSSKEIAPLLNISSRSVEVKRYRLRKKMDLPHESSLSDYILEV